MDIFITDDKKYYDQCVEIRRRVFVDEQHVPIEMEIDEHESDSVHVILLFNNEPAGTVRYRQIDETTIKVERMAVLKKFRGMHFGTGLVHFVHLHAQAKDFLWAKLSAQTHAIEFYETLGYQVSSDEYDDAGIPHVDMVKSI